MPSAAAKEFNIARARARILINLANASALSPINEPHRGTCLHAALAALVAAWESYLEQLVREVQGEVANPTDVRLSAVLKVLGDLTTNQVAYFNTPNAENSRNLLISNTGYDPINDWTSVGLNGLQTRQRLNEILKVRHSFAHGFPIPTNIAWIKKNNMQGRLSTYALRQVDRFLTNLVKATDAGMKQHITSVFGISVYW